MRKLKLFEIHCSVKFTKLVEFMSLNIQIVICLDLMEFFLHIYSFCQLIRFYICGPRSEHTINSTQKSFIHHRYLETFSKTFLLFMEIRFSVFISISCRTRRQSDTGGKKTESQQKSFSTFFKGLVSFCMF